MGRDRSRCRAVEERKRIVLKMRRRAWEMIRLALKARDKRRAAIIIEAFINGVLDRREALRLLRRLADEDEP